MVCGLYILKLHCTLTTFTAYPCAVPLSFTTKECKQAPTVYKVAGESGRGGVLSSTLNHSRL